MKVLIIGANGKIGKILTTKLSLSDKYKPTAFIRKQEQQTFFDEIGVPCIIESLEHSEEVISEVIKDFDTIVFTAGSGGKTGYDKTLEIDLDGAVKVILSAVKHQIKRFIMVSAAYADDRNFWEKSSIKPYYIAKHFADNELKKSNLDYTILRPVRLTDDQGTGKVKMSLEPYSLNSEVPREDVAEVIMNMIENKNSYRKVIEFSKGDNSISQAVNNL